jgi:hypothetical protein
MLPKSRWPRGPNGGRVRVQRQAKGQAMNFPVGKALAATFGYLAQHAPLLLKSLWLPTLLLTAAVTWVMRSYFDAVLSIMELGPNPDPNAMMPLMGPMFSSMGVMLLASAIFYPMIAAAALRHVVRGDTLKAPFYLGFAGDELRMLGAYLLFGIVSGLAYLVFVLGIGVLAGVVGVIAPAAGGAAALFLGVAGLVAMVWFLVRLSLTFPASMATRTLGLAQSWNATKGRSAGLFLFWLVICLLVAVLSIGYVFAAMPGVVSIYGDLFRASGDPAAELEATKKMLALQRDLVDPAKPGFWLYLVVTYLFTMIAAAIMYVAAGLAWRFVEDGR